MKRLVVGILAHVDAGKTTLSEALLFAAGKLRRRGRVDHGDAFLDHDPLERERGITIFSKQALLDTPEASITLLDTPGHVDFCAEAERTLQVLDCAVLVISGTDGVQSHTRTLWRLLERYHVPTFLFVGKMDLAGTDRAALLAALQHELDAGCTDFSASPEELYEAAAMCGENALEEYLSCGSISGETLTALIADRRLFPCCFGSALKYEGVEELLHTLSRLAPADCRGSEFAARVFKISRDAQGTRLTHLKVTGGTLRPKTLLPEGKVDQLRLYHGARFSPADAAECGAVVAVTGLENTFPGQGLGAEQGGSTPMLEPVLTYCIVLPEGCDAHSAFPKLQELADEDPMLRIVWVEEKGEIHVQLMGQIQLEILRERIAERYGLTVDFSGGSIVYRETVATCAEGIGHFEPLRHYAEVHLLLEPGERGSGVTVGTACPTDSLALNWQRLILTHLTEREHPGVLTGSALTDVRLTLIAGRAHDKHTEGGDFRQATYRAVRQGLMQCKSILLEPYYDFRLTLPPENVGRAISDIQAMGGQCAPPAQEGDAALLTGCAPVSGMRSYGTEVAVYTRGCGHLSCSLHGYEVCAAQQTVAEAVGYDPERDAANPTGSVFCEHGAGVYVPWQEVPQRAHIPPLPRQRTASAEQESRCTGTPRSSYRGSAAEDKELLSIFESTYGKVEHRAFRPQPAPARVSLDGERCRVELQKPDEEFLLVDGYNIIFAWEGLKRLAVQDIGAARDALIDILANYRGHRQCRLILVFDAYRVKGSIGSSEKRRGIDIIYTREAQTADSYIESATYALRRENRVRVATSDALEQTIILGHGATRISARAFEQEVIASEGEITAFVARYNLRSPGQNRLRSTAIIKENDR